MNVVIRPSAMNDLAAGFLFYEKQQKELGFYCGDCLFADIDSLEVYAGIHRKIHGCHRLLPKNFLTAFTAKLTMKKFAFAPCWIAAAIPNGFAKN